MSLNEWDNHNTDDAEAIRKFYERDREHALKGARMLKLVLVICLISGGLLLWGMFHG